MKTPFPDRLLVFVVGLAASAAVAENPPPDASPASAAIVRSRAAAEAPEGEYLPRVEFAQELATVRSRDVVRPAPQVALPVPNQFVASLPAQVVQPLPGGVIQPLTRQIVGSLPGQSVKPLPGQIVGALPGQIVQSLPGQVFR